MQCSYLKEESAKRPKHLSSEMLGVPSSFPAKNSPQRLSAGDGTSSRNKVALKPGRGLMDWIRLGNSGKDLQGFDGRPVTVTPEELQKHNTENDCWIALRGQVYNVTHYLEYHPGGIPELMRGAGKDATDLFDEVHKWVNYSSMLKKCCVGPLNKSYVKKSNPEASPKNKKNDGFLAPSGMLPTKLAEVMPRYDWYEKNDGIFVSIYTKSKVVHSTDVIMDLEDLKILDVKVLLNEKYYQLRLVQAVTGNKIDIVLTKQNTTKSWTLLGNALPGHNKLHLDKNRELKFRDCMVASVDQVTHDTKLFTIKLPDNVYYEIPVGHHVVVQDEVDEIEIRRNYTVALPYIDRRFTDTSLIGKHLHIMIKCYTDGALTAKLNLLKKGDKITVSDCTGNFRRSRMNNSSKIYLIAAGSGFTPMIRLIAYYLHEEEISKVKLIFANKTEDDILWKDQLEKLANDFKERFEVQHILSKPPQSWSGLSGRITEEQLKSFVTNTEDSMNVSGQPIIMKGDENSVDSLYAICGPNQFTADINRTLLDLGISEESIHSFLG